MKRIYQKLLVLCLVLSAAIGKMYGDNIAQNVSSESSSDRVISKVKHSDLNDNDAMLYVFKCFGYGDMSHGIVRFQAQDPENFENIKAFSSSEGSDLISAATYVNGEYWIYVYQSWYDGLMKIPVGIGVMDIETGEYEIKYKTNSIHGYGEHFKEMTYDPSTNKVYGAFYISDISSSSKMMSLWEIDPSEGTYEPKYIGKVDAYLYTMAVRNGVFYGITQDYDRESNPVKARLVKFTLDDIDANGVIATQTVADIDGGKRKIRYDQTMEFDHATGQLWWAASETANEGGFVCEVDINDGSLRHENRIPLSSQYVAMVIPYQYVADMAPSYVSNLTASTTETNPNDVTITWNNPVCDFQLRDLTSLSGVKIYRNGELVGDISTQEPGAFMTWNESEELEDGLYTYKIYAYNEAGDGLWREAEVYVGYDVAGKVTNVNYTVNQDEVTISWSQPEQGLNGGWYDKQSLKYDVYRGSYKLYQGITETTIEDKVDYYNRFTYKIVPVTNQGDGEASVLEIAFGPAEDMPYENDLSDWDMADQLTVENANADDSTWVYSEENKAYVYVSHYENVADDYLFLPALRVEEGKRYEFTFSYITSNYDDAVEDFEILLCGSANSGSVIKSLAKYENLSGANGGVWHSVVLYYDAEADDVATFAYRVYSKQGMGRLGISNIMIRELGSSEVRATGIVGDQDCYVGTETEFAVTIVNRGTAPINDTVVKIIDEEDNVLTQTTYASTIGVGESAEVKLAWTPDNVETLRLYGLAELAGDNYSSDDITPSSIRVSVHQADGDRFISLGKADVEKVSNLVDFTLKQSQSQIIYYADELGFDEDVYLTGIQFAYTTSRDADYLVEVPLKLSMKQVDADDVYAVYYDRSFVDVSKMTPVNSAPVDLCGLDYDYNEVYIPFDEPFEYKVGSDLIVDISKVMTERYDNVGWHIDFTPGRTLRGAYWSSDFDFSQYPMNEYMRYLPFTKFSYKKVNSVDRLSDDAMIGVRISDANILLSEVCESVSLYDISGLMIHTESDSDIIPINNLRDGVYLLSIVNDGRKIVRKIVIR